MGAGWIGIPGMFPYVMAAGGLDAPPDSVGPEFVIRPNRPTFAIRDNRPEPVIPTSRPTFRIPDEEC
jgi:hypothetical protein